MKRIGNPRVVLWVLIAALLVYVGYIYKSADNSLPPKTSPVVSQATVISDFRELKDIQVPMEAELGGHFYATEYVRIEDGHILATISYRIEELTEDVPTKASYTPLEDHGPSYAPDGEYTVKSIEEQEFQAGNSE